MLLNEKEKRQGFSVRDKSVCIVGCGGLGCNVAVHLTGAGIGELILCDFDRIEKSNLNRQFLYTCEDIGKSKCLTMAERLSAYSKDTRILCFEKEVHGAEDLSFAEKCDMIILAVDNSATRKTAEQFCTEKKIPLVCGGIDGFYGVCYLYVPDFSPSPEKVGLNEGNGSSHDVSSTAGIIGALQAATALRYLLTGDNSLAGRLTVYDDNKFDTLELK